MGVVVEVKVGGGSLQAPVSKKHAHGKRKRLLPSLWHATEPARMLLSVQYMQPYTQTGTE